MSLVFALAGLPLAAAGLALMFNARGASDWWVALSVRQREQLGRVAGPSYDCASARVLGLVTLLFGLMFLTVAIFGP